MFQEILLFLLNPVADVDIDSPMSYIYVLWYVQVFV